jgi:hypothetical protein
MQDKIDKLIQTIIDKKLGTVAFKQQSINIIFPEKFFSVLSPGAMKYADAGLVQLQIDGLQKYVDKLIGDLPVDVIEPVVEVPTVVEAPKLTAQSVLEKIADKSHLKKK